MDISAVSSVSKKPASVAISGPPLHGPLESYTVVYFHAQRPPVHAVWLEVFTSGGLGAVRIGSNCPMRPSIDSTIPIVQRHSKLAPFFLFLLCLSTGDGALTLLLCIF